MENFFFLEKQFFEKIRESKKPVVSLTPTTTKKRLKLLISGMKKMTSLHYITVSIDIDKGNKRIL